MRTFRQPAVTALQPRWRAVGGVAAAGLVVGCTLLALQFTRVGWEPTAPFVVGTSWRLDEELATRHLDVRVTPATATTASGTSGLPMTRCLGRGRRRLRHARYRAGRPLQAVAGRLLAVGLLLGLYGLVPSAELLARFLSSMRVLAPAVLGAGLAVAAAVTAPMDQSNRSSKKLRLRRLRLSSPR